MRHPKAFNLVCCCSFFTSALKITITLQHLGEWKKQTVQKKENEMSFLGTISDSFKARIMIKCSGGFCYTVMIKELMRLF